MRPRPIRYMVVAMGTRLSLSEAVNGWMADGWVPIGGATVDKDGYYIQAMILEERK